MFIIAFDPGGTTGWATYEDGEFDRGQIGHENHHRELYEMLESVGPDVVCYETFTYQIRNKHKYAAAAVNLISVEYIGVIKLWHQMQQRTNIELVARHASHAKSTWTDDKLKALGLWVPSNPHAMDATRHLLAHLIVDRKMTELLAPLRPT